jgi:hypothetical protein
MRRILFITFVMLMISACMDSKTNTEAFPTQTLSPSATSTPVPSSLILADFPLAIGTTWKYSAEISNQNPAEGAQVVKWSGSITVEVVETNVNSDGDIFFTLHQELEPRPSQAIWRKPDTYYYTLSGDGVFQDRAKIYQFPVSDNASWYLRSDFSFNRWYAKYIGNVEVPYGKFEGCYVFDIDTNTDAALETFCSGVGFVKHEYVHHSGLRHEKFVLISYKPSQ